MVPHVPEGCSVQQQLVCSVIPPLNSERRKGQAGRVGIVGGSAEYTGAPYFAAMAALRTGADLVHVFCHPSAATAIKAYSPELIVHPTLDAAVTCLPRLHAVVVGPGLGRDVEASWMPTLFNRIREQGLPVVVDADGLLYVTQNPDLIRGYSRAILTPNAVELDRLYRAVLGSPPRENAVPELARALGHVTVLAKGSEDIISDGHRLLRCTEQGSPRRCGGQGDLVSGSLALFAFWSHSAHDTPGEASKRENSEYGPAMIAALGAAMLVRRCGRLAFQKMARSTLSSDMLAEVRTAFSMLFPVD
ncbi:ATP-dependent (S)-NAD(P)H-hydrate dehydratase [Ixodes scapularis]|uniref:ATP-dependent (S)-NAD(P)H-hydrate dehydratase n=1 Tax=Ixodes scapularis TaxID=6945 RepID=UPI001AA00359|nr:ATP-dependent (S)-NAD(P)H-hydrate dehydratase [Ixodes scapularis]